MTISSAVDASAVARTVGIKTSFVNLLGGNTLLLPQRIAVVAQGNTAATYDTTKYQITSAYEAGSRYGFGSPIHLIAKQLLPSNGDGVGTIPVTVYPLEDNGSGVAATGTITPTGTATAAGTLSVKVAGIESEPIVVAIGDTVADLTAAIKVAIDSVVDMPVTTTDNTTDIDLVAKWEGTTGNDIVVEVVGSVAGLSFAVVQPTSGANNPDVDDALNQIGDVWETMILNGASDVTDTTTLDKYQTVNEGRWGALTRKPFVVFTGLTETSVATAITVPDARKTDRTNALLVAPGSDNHPFVVAARQLARIAVIANNNPAKDYGSQRATGIVPGTDAEQWTYTQRDQAVKGGSSTIKIVDNVVNIADIVTFYHPSGDPTPAYRYVVDIVKLQNIIFNLDVRFNVPAWDGAPLIPDGQPTVNPDAKNPSMAKAVVAAMIDGLAANAIISDPATAKTSIQADINATNPKRLDIAFTVQLAGNTNIISIDLNFGFYFGSF